MSFNALPLMDVTLIATSALRSLMKPAAVAARQRQAAAAAAAAPRFPQQKTHGLPAANSIVPGRSSSSAALVNGGTRSLSSQQQPGTVRLRAQALSLTREQIILGQLQTAPHPQLKPLNPNAAANTLSHSK